MAQNTGYMKMGADKSPEEGVSLGEMEMGALAKPEGEIAAVTPAVPAVVAPKVRKPRVKKPE